MNIHYLSGRFGFHYLMDRLQSQQWRSGNSPVLFPLLSLSTPHPPSRSSLSLILNHHLQRQRQLKPIECFNAHERHLKLNKQGTPG